MKNTIPTRLKYTIAILFFLISLSQNMAHIMKDSMILSIGGGFKAVPILKAIGIPFTILFSIIYNHFLNKYSIKNIFVYFMISTILCLYVFSFILIKHYMYIDRSTYNAMQTTIVMWPISIFYIISDFWIAASRVKTGSLKMTQT